MRWLAENYVLEADEITVLNEDPAYPFTESLIDPRMSRVGRTTTNRNIYFDFDLGSAKTISYICIAGHNLSSTATITLYGNTNPDLTDYVAVFTVPFSEFVCTAINDGSIGDSTYFQIVDENGNFLVDEYGNNICGFLYTSTYQYWRIFIDDVDNTDGYLEVSKIYLGDSLQMPFMAKTQKLPTASTGVTQYSSTGQPYSDKGYSYIYGTISFPIIEDSEKIDIDAAFRIVEKTTPSIILIWENDLTYQLPIYLLLTTDLDWTRVENLPSRRWSLQFGFREIR